MNHPDIEGMQMYKCLASLEETTIDAYEEESNLQMNLSNISGANANAIRKGIQFDSEAPASLSTGATGSAGTKATELPVPPTPTPIKIKKPPKAPYHACSSQFV